MNKYKTKIKHPFFGLMTLAMLWAVPLFLPLLANAADSLVVTGQLFYWTSGGRQFYTAGANPDNAAQGITYRSNIYAAPEWNYGAYLDDRVSFNTATSQYPALYQWDPGSSFWASPLYVAGDRAVSVFETKNGQFGWTGDTWVGGTSTTITSGMITNQTVDFQDIVMEPVPTPALVTSNLTSIVIGWKGLWDNTTGASGGVSNNSVFGYKIYRSMDGGAYSEISGAVVSQNPGADLSYTDSNVSLGHSYRYKLGVLFQWTAKPGTPYYETTSQGPPSSSLGAQTPDPDRLALTASSWSVLAGTKSSIITVESRDSSGSSTPVKSDTTVDLSSNSTSNHKFYSVSAGACTSTEITQLTISNGNSSAQFCYYDEKTPSWMLTAHKSAPASPSWIDGVHAITINPSSSLGSLSIVLENSQKNRKAFTGTNTITAIDTFGNIKTDFESSTNNITMSVSPSDGSISGLSGTTKLNLDSDFSNGVATLTSKMIFSGTGGNHTFTATSADGKSTTSGNVNIQGGDLASFDFSLAPSQAMDTVFSGTNTLTAKDADGNVVADFNAASQNVTISESLAAGLVTGLGSGGNGTLNASGDFVNGVANLTGKMKYGGLAGSRTFKAVSGSVTSDSNSVTFGAGTFAKFGFNLNSPQANDAFFSSANLTAEDIYGNIVINYDPSAVGQAVTLSVSGSGTMAVSGRGSAKLDQATDFVGGTANLAGKLKYTGPIGTQTVTATSDNGKTGATNTTIQSGAAVSVKINNNSGSGATEVSSMSMDIDSPTAFWAAAYDVSGNFIGNSMNGHWTVSGFDSGDDNAQINVSNATNITFAPHVAPQTGTIHFDNGSGITDSTGMITIVSGAPTSLSVEMPSSVTAGTGFVATKITAKDKYGNIAVAYSGSKTLNVSGPSIGPENGTPSSSITATFTNGVADSSSQIILVKEETKKMTLTDGSLNGTSDNIDVASGSIQHFEVVSPASVTAGLSFNMTSITAHDQYGNVAKTYSGTKTIAYSGPSASDSGMNPTYTASVNFSNGVSTTSLATVLYKAETVKIHVAEGSSIGDSNDVTVQAGAAESIEKVTGDNQSGTVNANLSNPLVVLVKDVYGNLKNNYDVSFVITVGDGSLTPAFSRTGADGKAQSTWKLGSISGSGFNRAEARGAGLTGSPIVFNATGSPSTATLLDVTAPTEVTAGEPFDISVKAFDSFGNLVTSYEGTKTLSYAGPNSSADNTAPKYATSADFAGGKNDSISTTLYKAETTTLSVTIGSLTGDSLPIVVKSAESKTFAVLAPSSVIVKLPFIISSIRALDDYGNVAIGYEGSKTIDYSGPSSSSGGEDPSYTESVHFTEGVATTELETTLVKAEKIQISITDGTLTGKSNNIDVNYAEPFVLTYVSGNNQTGSPSTTLDNPLVAKVMDSEGKPAVGKVVTFTPASKSGSISPSSVTVGEDGLASVNWTLGSSENLQTVTATVPGLASTVLYVSNAGNGGGSGSNATRIVFTTMTQEIAKNVASGKITACLQSTSGNDIIAQNDVKANLVTSSSTGKFATSSDGSWDKTSATISSGSSCANFYYQDSTSGLMTMTASGTDLVSGTQSIYIQPDEASPQIITKEKTVTEEKTVYKTNKKSAAKKNSYTIIINNFFYDGSKNQGSNGENGTSETSVTLQASSAPIILSPRNSSLIMDTDEGVTVSGMSIPESTVVVMQDGHEVGSATSDKKGNWKTIISKEKIGSDKPDLTAKILGDQLESASVTFQIKKDASTWMNNLLDFLSSPKGLN